MIYIDDGAEGPPLPPPVPPQNPNPKPRPPQEG